MFHETFLTSTFSERRLPEGSTLRPDALRSLNVQDRRGSYGRRTNQGFIDIQALYHEKATLEAREVTKLHYRDSTSSNDEFSSYARSIKLISTSSMTHLVNNETLDLYSEGATLSKFIHEVKPTTTKPTFVALPSLTCHSTFYKCSRGILCQPQDSPPSPLTRLGVIISYALCLERKITLPLIQKSFHPMFTPSQVTNEYGPYTAFPAKKTTSAIIEIKIDKSLQFHVNQLNIARDTNIKARPKNSSQNLNFHSFRNPDPNIFIQAPFYNFNMSTPTNIPETPMGETEQDSFFESKEKFQQQLQDTFQTILRLNGPDHF